MTSLRSPQAPSNGNNLLFFRSERKVKQKKAVYLLRRKYQLSKRTCNNKVAGFFYYTYTFWLCTKRRLIFYYKGAYAAPLYPRRRVRPGAILRWRVNVGGCVVSDCFSAECSIAPPLFLGNEQSNLPPD